MLLNIHTHCAAEKDSWSIQNLYNNFERIFDIGKYSIGLHPWHIQEETWKAQIVSLKEYCEHKNVLAIGECGLDKVCNTDFMLQQIAFAEQIIWANQINKPLIIHCVKAWEEVFRLLRKPNHHVPVIFHGFNGKLSIAQQIIHQGYYLSFGKGLSSSRLQQVLATIPLNRIFFETDDADISIETIYQTAATALQIDINSLSLQINKNAADVFGANFLEEYE